MTKVIIDFDNDNHKIEGKLLPQHFPMYARLSDQALKALMEELNPDTIDEALLADNFDNVLIETKKTLKYKEANDA